MPAFTVIRAIDIRPGDMCLNGDLHVAIIRHDKPIFLGYITVFVLTLRGIVERVYLPDREIAVVSR